MVAAPERSRSGKESLNYRDLIAWQKSMDLVEAVYRATANFPREEVYGLTSQLRRAAVSVPSNIAEGQGRKLSADFKLFLRHSRGSLLEVDTQVQIAHRLGYLKQDVFGGLVAQVSEVGRILNGLIASV